MEAEKLAQLKNFGSKIANIAPYIAGIIGGPAAGAGAIILKEFFGTDDPKAMDAAIATMPIEKILELKALDVQLRQADNAVELGEQDNLTRRLELDVSTDSAFVKVIRPSLAVFWSLITAAVIVTGLYFVAPERSDFYTAALFATTSITGAIIGFYFGGRSMEKIATIRGKSK
jgi:hypothetical protein